MKNTPSFEILRIDEFAKRLKVGKSTVYDWKNNGTLVPGRHYIKKGKIVRYIWAMDLLLELHSNSIPKEKKRCIKRQ